MTITFTRPEGDRHLQAVRPAGRRFAPRLLHFGAFRARFGLRPPTLVPSRRPPDGLTPEPESPMETATPLLTLVLVFGALTLSLTIVVLAMLLDD